MAVFFVVVLMAVTIERPRVGDVPPATATRTMVIRSNRC